MIKNICFVLLATTLMFVGACSKNTLTNVEKGNRDSELYIANADEPESLDPHVASGSPDANIILGLFEGLASLDPKTLEPSPGVATHWDISEDGKVYTFYLRENAKWSNGDNVTAHDFIYSWRRALQPALAAKFAYMMYPIKNAEAFNTGKLTDFNEVGVKALTDYTLEITLAHPTPYFILLLDHHSFYPVHKATIEKHGEIDNPNTLWTRAENFVGNGPFTLAEWKINQHIKLAKNPHYWDANTVKLNALHFLPITDQQAEERAFRTGQVHLTYSPQMANEKIATYRDNHPDVFQAYYTYSSYYYIFNTKRAPFDNIKVRQAFSMAIDRESITKNVTKGGEIPTFSVIPPDPQGYKPKAYYGYNPEKAKLLLAEAGYPNGKGFPTFYIHYNTLETHKKVAVAVQQMLKNVLNIDVQLHNEEWKVYLSTQKNHNFDVTRQAWIADYADPSNFFEIFLSYGGNNHSQWDNKQYDALVEEAARTMDSAKRFKLFEQANKILADEMPIMPIYLYSDINLVQPYVKNWHPNILHRHHYKTVYLDPPEAP
ncbi:peptide ABC transporter substrate-binding protein [Saccharophagus degradans]|uniref:Peptide ABC transporter substrate-binding protein n=1 Tax=Saccharophagus degradans TaxID=86304 RepID=A0AAW7X3H9_9GAMM|nr:peptide ABC transporter substrate-binding protein [Saccharophagus degradans]MDO6421171.1 peptide ABC transporter substrate-binding protein [Saccharophagus degradans]MDO6605918.1 peptide ABC transporter substrate-binding protein [Saccharophagus degradans]